jgi:hypothetical protein
VDEHERATVLVSEVDVGQLSGADTADGDEVSPGRR